MLKIGGCSIIGQAEGGKKPTVRKIRLRRRGHAGGLEAPKKKKRGGFLKKGVFLQPSEVDRKKKQRNIAEETR